MALHFDRNQEATVWIGGLDENVDEELLWELMIQAGPVISVNIPRDKITREHQGYAFCEFASEEDADYAMKIMNMVRLYGKSLKINKASRDRKDTGVGANVFVGNLDPEVDDQLLYNTFSAFGQVLSAKVMYEDDGSSRGFAFVNFADFESSDAAILHMNGQFLCNRPVHVSYAYKKDTKGEKHGSETERLFAAKMQAKSVTRPHMHFASTAPQLTNLLSVAATLNNQQQIHVSNQQQLQQHTQHTTQQTSQQTILSHHTQQPIIPNSSLIGHQLPMGGPPLVPHTLTQQYTPATAQAIQQAAFIQQANMAMIQQQQQMAALQQARMIQQQQQQLSGKDQKNNNNDQKDQPPAPPPPNMFMRGPPPPRPPFPPPPGMHAMGYPPMPPHGHGFPPRPPMGAFPPVPGPPPPQPPQQMLMQQQQNTNNNNQSDITMKDKSNGNDKK